MKKIICSILICFCSCKLHKASHTIEKQTQKEYNVQHTASVQDSLWRESLGYSFTFAKENQWGITRIKPLGLFTYTPDSGFRGGGEEIIIFQNIQQQSVKLDSQYRFLQQGSQGMETQEINTNERQYGVSVDKKMRQGPMHLWGLLGLVALAVFVGIFYFKVRS